MIPKKGITTHPGEMLSEEFLKPMGITQAAFARHIGIDVATLSAVINGRRDMTPTMVMKISMALGVEPEMWFNLQAMHEYTKNREMLRSKRQLPKVKLLPELKEALSVIEEWPYYPVKSYFSVQKKQNPPQDFIGLKVSTRKFSLFGVLLPAPFLGEQRK